MLITSITSEWKDKKLNGSRHYRNNDIPLLIEITSNDNPSLIGMSLTLEFYHYNGGTKTTITKTSSGESSNITIEQLEPGFIRARTLLDSTELASLPSTYDIGINYKLNATFSDTATITLQEGSFISAISV